MRESLRNARVSMSMGASTNSGYRALNEFAYFVSDAGVRAELVECVDGGFIGVANKGCCDVGVNVAV